MIKKSSTLILIATAVVALITSCKKNEPETKPEIKVTTPTVTLATHELGSTSATFTTTAPWTLSLSDTRAVPSWFTVDKTSGGAGTHTITLTVTEANPSTTESRSGYIQIVSGKITSTITITQPKAVVIAVTGVSLSKSATSISIGGTETLTATIAPANATNQSVSWSSSNSSVATVSSGGVVTAVATGTATITVTTTDGSKTATCSVTVTEPVTGVTLNKTAASLWVGGTETLTATVAPANAINTVTWSSNNTAVATVDNGVVTAVGPGTATITVTTVDGGKKATCNFTIIQPVTGVTLNKTTVSLSAGTTETLIATINPSNATNKRVRWESSNETVASVAEGVITAKAAGTATISVTTEDGNKTATCTVTVTQPVTGITLDKTMLGLEVGKTATLTSTVAPTNATNKNINWTSSNAAVATVTAQGVVQGVKAGSATITATAADGSGKSATCQVVVTALDMGNGGGVDL